MDGQEALSQIMRQQNRIQELEEENAALLQRAGRLDGQDRNEEIRRLIEKLGATPQLVSENWGEIQKLMSELK